MGSPRKFDLDRRLEAYFVTLRSSPLKQRVGNWQIYAAVTGSAMAMVTNASASIIGTGIGDVNTEPITSARTARRIFATSRNTPLVNSVRLAMGRQDSGARLLIAAAPDSKISHATQAQPPSISTGGIVPLYSTAGVIQ